jgi:putative cardiolipin synthase
MNIANEYFRVENKAEHRWRDQDIMVRGAVVKDLVAAFDRNFADQQSVKAGRGSITDKTQRLLEKGVSALPLPLLTERSPDGGRATLKFARFQDQSVIARIQAIDQAGSAPAFSPAKVRFIQNRPRLQESYISQAYLAMIRSARSEILISNAYFIPKGELLREMQAAAKRGVAITILTNSDTTNDLPQMADVSRYCYQYLLSADAGGGGKVRIYEWQGKTAGGAQEDGTMHSKFMIVDRQSMIVGSYNLDPRSEKLNSETVMALDSETLAQGLAKDFLEGDLAKARPISAEEAAAFHNPKGIKAQFRQGFAMSIDSWLSF